MKKRYIIGILLLGLIAVMIWVRPVLPVIQLPGETLASVDKDGLLGIFYPLGLTNTFIATVLTWIVVLLMVFGLRAKSRNPNDVPSGFYNFMEMVVEGAYNFVEGQAGKWTKQIFPWFMTFVLTILVANWMELIPGVDSIGIAESEEVLLHHLEHKVEKAEIAALTEAHPDWSEDEIKEEAHHIVEGMMVELEHEVSHKGGRFANEGFIQLLMFEPPVDETDAEGNLVNGNAGNHIIPYVRAAATDLNFTLALAIISVVMTQYYGFRANGIRYLSKFFTFNADKIKESPLSLMDTLVGILEFISEVSKILSFAFRLLGNIFAGQVLLFVIGSLAAVANVGVFGLELFVGAIQAAVFGMLTLTFMSQAVQEPHH